MTRINTLYVHPEVLSGVDLGEDGYLAGAHNVLYISGLTAPNTSTVYLQLHDGYEEPDASAVPVVSLPIASTSSLPGFLEMHFRPHGLRLSTGMAVVLSSTHSTYTPVASNCFVHVEYYK